jgi:hypothetical protein
MPINSLLSPEKISPSSRASIQNAQNFISGGSPIGESVVQSASNKIVGFQRAEVRPVSPSINSIISSITNNVLSTVDNSIKNSTQIINNNVDNKIANVTERLTTEIKNVRSSGPVTQLQNVVQVVQNKINQSIQKIITDFSNDYNNKIKNIEENKPSQVLDKFLKVYRNALEFVQFFGNQKNVDRLRTNLVALKNSFNESFEVAKLVRQVIVKIVNQLSNLPRATPSGGGLNLDVKVPGSPLKKAGAPAMKRMGAGKMLGLGALGLGAAGLGGGAVVNALSDSEQVQPQQVQTDLPQNLVDRFGAVVDRFSNILDALIGRKKEENVTVTSPGSPSPPPKPKTDGPPGGPADFSGSEKAEQAFNYFISQGYTKEQSAAIVGNLLQENTTMDPTLKNSIKHKGIAQWDPDIRYPALVKFAKDRGLNPDDFQTQLQYVEEELKTGSGGLSKSTLQSVKSLEQATLLVRKQYLRPGESEARDDNRLRNARDVLSKFGENVKAKKLDNIQKASEQISLESSKLKDSMVSPSSDQTEIAQQRAAVVSQPPPTQVASSTNILPIDLSSTQQSGGGGGSAVSSPPSQKNGPTVPLLPSSNPDNFLVLYSKIVYNVVDG